MSDITIPSYRVQRGHSGPSWPMLAVAGGLLGTVALAGAIAWSVSQSGPRTIPVIEADSRPIKVRPEDPGGLVVPNIDQLVLEPPAVRRAMEREQAANARLAPAPEAPALDLLLLQTAPPTPQAAPPAPLASVPPSVPAPDDLPPIAAPASGPATSGAALPGTPASSRGDVSRGDLSPDGAAAPAVAPPVPAQPRATPEPAGRAMVQLGALSSEEAALGEWNRLQRRIPELAGRQPQVTRFDRGGGQPPLWRLRTGGLADTEAARALCEAVRSQGGACMAIGG